MRVLSIALVVLGLALSTEASLSLFASSSQQCTTRCTDNDIAFPLPRGELAWKSDLLAECDGECRRSACDSGCAELENLPDACESRCTIHTHSEAARGACVQGCHAIEQAFLSHLQEHMSLVDPENPEMDEAGVHLLWKFPSDAAAALNELSARDVRWYTHSRSTTGSNDGWKWHAMENKPFTNGSLNASVVLPTQSSGQLQIRLAAVWRSRVAVSNAKNVQIAARFLSSELELIAQLQTGRDSYALCWRSNRLAGQAFRVTLTTLDGNAISSEETTERCHQLKELPRENCCRVTVSDVLPEKAKPPVPANVTAIPASPDDAAKEELIEKKPPPTESPKDDDEDVVVAQFTVKIDLFEDKKPPSDARPQLVFTNGSYVLLLDSVDDYVMAVTPITVPFDVEEGDAITALAGVNSTTLVIGTEKGALWLVSIDPAAMVIEGNETLTVPRIATVLHPQRALRDPDGAAIKHIALDSMQRSIYAVLSTKGVLRCPLVHSTTCTFYASDPINPITAIAIDSWNGFVYMINTNKDVYQAELFPYNATDVYTFVSLKKIPAISPAVAIEMNHAAQQLISVLENGTIVRRDVITSNTRIIREGAGFAKVKSFRASEGRLFWTKEKCGDTPLDEICFYSEEAREDPSAELHFSRYLYSGGRIVDFSFLVDPILPPLIMAPSQIGIAVSSTHARVTWTMPQPLPFQAPGPFWRAVAYRVKLIGENGTVLLQDDVDANDVVVPVSGKQTLSASVRACTQKVCSQLVTAINTALDDVKHPLVYVVKKSNDKIDVYDVIGLPTTADDSIESMSAPRDIESAFVFDNVSKTAYVSSDDPPGVSHILATSSSPTATVPTSNSNNTVFFPGLVAKHLALLSSRAVLIVASHYHIVAYRLTGTLDAILHECPPDANECPEVMAVAADQSTEEIYFLLHHPNSTAQLLRINSEKRAAHFVASSQDFPQIRQLIVAGDRLMFVTRDGKMGFCDKELGFLNVNYALTEISMLLPITPATKPATFDFTGTIAMSDANKFEMKWDVEPKTPMGMVLFHALVYAEHIGVGEPRHLFSLSPSVTLPYALLDSWSSGQHFDVVIRGRSIYSTAEVNRTGLIAPTKPPTKPTKLNIYATQQKTVDGPRAIISLFWSPPLEWNGNAFQYNVNCTQEGGTIGGIVPSSHLYYSFAVKSGKVSCAVAAANEPKNVGEFSETAEIDSSELRPLVRLFAIDSTNSLISITNITAEMANVRRRRQLNKQIEYEALAFIGNDLYAVRREPDTSQILLVQIDTNQIENTVHKVSVGGDITRIDAMTSDWVGHRLLFVAGKSLYHIGLDPFLSTSILTPRKLIDLSPGAADAKQLTYDPFTNTAYLLTRNGSLFSLNLWKGQEENLALSLEGLSSRTITWMMAEFAWNQASSPRIYALTWNGMITIDMQARKCEELQIDWAKFGERGLKSISAFSIADKLFVFVTSSEMLIYGKDSIVPITIANPPLRQILAVSQSSQPFPERFCFSLPSSSTIDFKIVNEGRTGALIEVTPPPPRVSCAGISAPSTQYDVYFTRKGTDKVKHVRSFSETIHVENGILDKETGYEVTVSWSNRYSPSAGVSGVRAFRTGFGYPSPPRDPLAVAISPDTLYLFWKLPETLNAPKKEIKYRISQQSLSSPSQIAVQEWKETGFQPTTSDHGSCSSTPCRVRVTNLRPSTYYKFWVTAIHESRLNSPFPGDSEASSMEFTTRTKDVPGTLRPDNITGSSILLKWTSLQPENPPTVVSIQYKESGGNGEWRSPSNATFEGAVPSLSILLNNLLAATSYSFRFVAVYSSPYDIYGSPLSYKEDYYQGVQLARTKAGTPTSPREVEAKVDEEGWIVQWTSPQSDGGSPITSYAVEVRVNESAEWEIAERGLDGWKMSWRPTKTDADTFSWQFRVRAANQEGFGAYGYTSSETPHARSAPVRDDNVFVFVIAVAVMTVGGLIVAALLLVRHKLNEARGKAAKIKVDNKSITLEKMADFSTTSQNASLQNEIKNLPRIQRSDITLGDQLGIGRFGNVHKAIAKQLPHTDEENVAVAVKVLRERYSDDDCVRFKKEAILVNNFDHTNIVRLLGVCIEGEQVLYIVVEHMTGGDLKSFLNACRQGTTSPALTLREILTILIDIARGCSYLEQNGHVHRELAARNCFLSTEEASTRVTKIAHFGHFDFGKAQSERSDVLRWLSPETLRDGVFDAATVVWSYGMVIFEVLTLGMVPHEDVDNEKVRDTIIAGTPIRRPHFAPTTIFCVAQDCWKVDPTSRPSFPDLLQQLEAIRECGEYQDEKPYPTEHSRNFSASMSSSGSEGAETAAIGSSQHASGNSSGASASVLVPPSRKSSRPSSVRALKEGTTRPAPLPAMSPLHVIPPQQDFDVALRSPVRPLSMYSSSHPPSPRSPLPPFALSSDAAIQHGFSEERTLSAPKPPAHNAFSYTRPMLNPGRSLHSSSVPSPERSERDRFNQARASISAAYEADHFPADDGNLSQSWAAPSKSPPSFEDLQHRFGGPRSPRSAASFLTQQGTLPRNDLGAARRKPPPSQLASSNSSSAAQLTRNPSGKESVV